MFPSLLTALAHPVCLLIMFPHLHRVNRSLTNYDSRDLWKPAKNIWEKMSGWRGYLIAFTLCYLRFFQSELPPDHGRTFLGEGHIWSCSICSLCYLHSFHSGLPPDLQSWVVETEWGVLPGEWLIVLKCLPFNQSFISKRNVARSCTHSETIA